MSTEAKCTICGQPMPEGEEMFQYHGYSGPCPVPASPPATGKAETWQEAPKMGETLHTCTMGPDCPNHPTFVSPAPAAPGVDLDFEKAVVDASSVGGYRDPEFVAECIRDEHVNHDTYGFLEAIQRQHRALIDAARKEERAGREVAERNWLATCAELDALAPLLALVEEWQEAKKAWQANKISCGCEECIAERRDKSDRYDRAEAALAAWRKP